MTTGPEPAPAHSTLEETPASTLATSEPAPVAAPPEAVSAAHVPVDLLEVDSDGADAARRLVARVHPFG
jgi:hypothetical protein